MPDRKIESIHHGTGSRVAKLERLVKLSTDPDSLDWDVLAKVDELAWGAEDAIWDNTLMDGLEDD